jgi:hypothetical protein
MLPVAIGGIAVDVRILATTRHTDQMVAASRVGRAPVGLS